MLSLKMQLLLCDRQGREVLSEATVFNTFDLLTDGFTSVAESAARWSWSRRAQHSPALTLLKMASRGSLPVTGEHKYTAVYNRGENDGGRMKLG